MTDFFLSKDVNLINGDNYGSILPDGTVYSPSITANDCINLSDEWTRNNSQYNGPDLIGKVNVEDLYNIDKNFLKDSNGDTPSTYIYDNETGVLTFKDQTLSKKDLLGCTFAGSDEVALFDIVRDLELLSAFSRIADFGPVYDVKFRQVSFGDYKFYNELVCSNIAKTLGYLSFDKVLNDEYARKKYQNELNAKYVGTAREADFPPYSGFLDQSDYKTGGWVSIDQVIHSKAFDPWAYDEQASLAIRTKRIKDRKRAIVHLLLTYASNVWSLNSDNKLVDFGLRIKDRTTDKVLDYSDVKNGLNGFVGNAIIAQFSGDLGDASETVNGAAAPSCDKQTSCNKVFIDKCSKTNFLVACDSSSTEEIDGVVHELMPQFRLNPIQKDLDNKPDVLETIDAIHWTTGINEIVNKEGIDITWINDLITEFGDDTYRASFLNSNRAFHYVGGTYLDAFAANGFFYNISGTDSAYTYVWGSRSNSEIWNGIAWTTSSDLPVSRGLGIGGGNSSFALTAWGCDPFGGSHSSVNEPSLMSSLTPSTNTLVSSFCISNVVSNSVTWSILGLDPIISKHSVAGIINTTVTQSGGGNGQDNFGKKKISKLNTCIEGCFSTTSAVNNFVDPENTDAAITVMKNASGICFNGSTGNITLSSILDSDLDYNFIYFSYANVQKFKSNKQIADEQAANPNDVISPFDSLETMCSYVDNTKRYPIKTVGTCYVGTSTHGIATGGKTSSIISGCIGMENVKESLYDRYFNKAYWNQNNDSIIRYAYEWNNIAWTRVEDMAEDIAYHCGVGDEKWALFWGGLHGTIELANIKSTLEDCDNWCSTANIFGGVCHRDTFCSLNDSIRYTDFATEITDINNNVLYQINDPKDVCKIGAKYSPEFVNSLDINWQQVGTAYSTDGAAINYGVCPTWTGNCQSISPSGVYVPLTGSDYTNSEEVIYEPSYTISTISTSANYFILGVTPDITAYFDYPYPPAGYVLTANSETVGTSAQDISGNAVWIDVPVFVMVNPIAIPDPFINVDPSYGLKKFCLIDTTTNVNINDTYGRTYISAFTNNPVPFVIPYYRWKYCETLNDFICGIYTVDSTGANGGTDAFYFEPWDDEVYHRGHFKQFATPISGNYLEVNTFYEGTTVISEPTVFTLPSVSAACTYDGASDFNLCDILDNTPDISGALENLAKRDNVTYNLNGGYKVHPSSGGMWLWSRPTKGENLYHPENFCPYNYVNDFSSFGTPTSGSIYSFYVDENKDGLVQAFYGERKDTFVEQWNNPYSMQLASITASIVWDGNYITASDISGFSGTTSVGTFIPPVSGSYNLPEVIRELVSASFTSGAFDISGSDYNNFLDWFYSDNISAYPVKAYDNNHKWFVDNGIMKTTNISGSSVRDRAALFPWNELLCGDVDNKATEGAYAWMWGDAGSLYLAECVFADTVSISGDWFTDSIGRVIAISASNYEPAFWREVFRIRYILANGEVKFDYYITYDESQSDPIIVMSGEAISGSFSLFGSNSKFREVDDTRWNVKTIHDLSKTWVINGPEFKTTTSYNWLKDSHSIPSEAYNYVYRNLCDITTGNFNVSPATTGILNAISISGNMPVWIWSVPYEDDITNSTFFIHKSELVPVDGAEVVKVHKNAIANGTTYVSRSVMAGPNSNGIGFFDFGMSTGISGKPFDYSIENSTVIHPDYTTANKCFPWCVLSDDSTFGPTSMVDMMDTDGNYWVAFGDSYNKRKTDITNNYYVNNYTIVRVPQKSLVEFDKLVLARENRRIAEDSFTNYQVAGGLNPSGILANNKASRSREAVLELINTRNGTDIFDVYIKLFEYVLDNSYIITKILANEYDYAISQIPILPDINVYTLPIVPNTNEIDQVHEFILATEKDNECINCDVCLGVDSATLPPWIEHIHDEWATRNLESWGNGPFGRSNFNAWLAAGCDTKWGVSLWSTFQGGRIWFNYKASDLRVDVSRKIISYAVIVASIKVEDLTNDTYENVPVLVKYDEFHFDMDAYINTPLVQTALFNNEDNISFCKAPSTIFVPETMWASCVSGSNFLYMVDISGSDISGNPFTYTIDISGTTYDYTTTEDIDPTVGYTEWVTSFAQEYRQDDQIQDKNFVDKYYRKYNVNNPGSNCLIKRDEIADQSLVGTSWRRFQDNVGVGGNVPIFNIPSDVNKNVFDLTATNFGQKAFGDPDKAIICGGYAIGSTGELQKNKSFWGFFTNGPTFKWNRTVINPEDTINANYKSRTVSPFYSNGSSTLSNSNMGAIIFDVSKKVNIERLGTALFDGSTTSVDVSFASMPEYVTNKTAYAVSLTAGDNIKVWWSDKTETKFTINIEVVDWRGSVDWVLTLVTDVPASEINGTTNERKTYDRFEEA